jgi:hypothetical protein
MLHNFATPGRYDAQSNILAAACLQESGSAFK